MYDKCLNCGLEGIGDNDPWKHTYRFETDEDICKQCGASYETSSAKHLQERLNNKTYDHHAEHANREVHAIQARERE